MAVTINGSAGVTTNSGAVYNGLQTDTAKSATGTAVDFTGIPSWVKRVTVMLKGVSTSGTSKIRIRIGPSGGVETSGYLGAATTLATSSMATANFTAGIDLNDAQAATSVRHGAIMFSLIDSSTNTWVFNGGEGQSDTTNAGVVFGSIALSGTLTQIRITTVNGTDTFDAGTINIIYE